MPVRVFDQQEKEEIREKLLSVGFPLLQEYGWIHMSVPKIAAAAEIGTGTFYRFFKSKEEYLYQLIQYRRQLMLQEIIPEEVRRGERRLSSEEVRQVLTTIVDPKQSVYANLKLVEETSLFAGVEELKPNLEREKQISRVLLSYIEGIRENLDFAVLANMMKILAITSQAREELHPEGYERTITLLIDSIMELMFQRATEE